MSGLHKNHAVTARVLCVFSIKDLVSNLIVVDAVPYALYQIFEVLLDF